MNRDLYSALRSWCALSDALAPLQRAVASWSQMAVAAAFRSLALSPREWTILSLVMVTFYYFGVNIIWNALREQKRFGEHHSATKKVTRGPNKRAQGLGALIFIDFVCALVLFAIVFFTKLERKVGTPQSPRPTFGSADNKV